MAKQNDKHIMKQLNVLSVSTVNHAQRLSLEALLSNPKIGRRPRRKILNFISSRPQALPVCYSAHNQDIELRHVPKADGERRNSATIPAF